MSLLRSLYDVILDALFPLSSEEMEVISLTPEQAVAKLPPAQTPPIADATSVFAYKDEMVRKLVWSIKYKKTPNSVAIGGLALYRALSNFQSFQSPILIVPIPITERRRRERGYNQCELLVDEIHRLDVAQNFHIEKDLLVRTQHKSRQTLKDRSERLESAHNIFSVDSLRLAELKETGANQAPNSLLNTPLIVIDDVITTGSTMNEALTILRNAGFTNVRGVSLAH